VEVDILLAVKHIENGSTDSRKPVEVTDSGRRIVHSADAAELSPKSVKLGASIIEALGSSAQSAEQVEVPDFSLFNHCVFPPCPIVERAGHLFNAPPVVV
jgi:hypothetical protein